MAADELKRQEEADALEKKAAAQQSPSKVPSLSLGSMKEPEPEEKKMNGDPEIISEGEFIESDRNMTDRDGDLQPY